MDKMMVIVIVLFVLVITGTLGMLLIKHGMQHMKYVLLENVQFNL